MKIMVGEDCGNAPKKALLRDFNIAFAKHESEHILQNIANDIRWNVVGDKLVEGKDHVTNELPQMMYTEATALTLNNVITHGNTGTVDGIIKLGNGHSYAFCDVYRFSSSAKDAKIKEITSYRIEI